MKLSLRLIAFLFVALGVAVQPCVAEEAPQQVVDTMMAKIKEVGSPSPFIAYVNWDSAYSKLNDTQKTQMKVSSGEEMKAVFEKMFNDTEGFFREKFDEKIVEVPEEQRAQHEARFKMMVSAIQQQKAKMKEQIQKTEYKIGETNVEGDTATVDLTQSLDGTSRTRTIHLTKASGKWLLDSASIFTEDPKAETAAPKPSQEAAAAE